MTKILFHKANIDVNIFREEAIVFITLQKDYNVNVATIVGMPQFKTAIAGVMVEENIGCYESPNRTRCLDTYALS